MKAEVMWKGLRWIVDDVTKLNQGLINRLSQHPVESARYFNGSVYGQTKCNERIRFDLYDNIHSVIRENRKQNYN